MFAHIVPRQLGQWTVSYPEQAGLTEQPTCDGPCKWGVRDERSSMPQSVLRETLDPTLRSCRNHQKHVPPQPPTAVTQSPPEPFALAANTPNARIKRLMVLLHLSAFASGLMHIN